MPKLWQPFSRFHPAYLPLLFPVAPPGATMGPKSRIQPGKAPALYSVSGRYWHGYDWTKRKFTPEDHARMAGWPAGNVGLRCGDPALPILCLDLDVDFDASAVVDEIQLLYGPAPLQLRGPYRRKLIFRAPKGIERHARFTAPDGTGRHGFDLLFAGRQIVVDGLHPSGQPYQWAEGLDLRSAPPESLPEITDPEGLVADVTAAFERLGCKPLAAATAAPHAAEHRPLPCADLEAPEPLVRSWLAAIPNGEDWHQWDRFVLMGRALKAASGGEPWGLELYHAWAGQWAEGYDAGLVDDRWSSFKDSALGADWLRAQALERGWKPAGEAEAALDPDRALLDDSAEALAAAEAALRTPEDAWADALYPKSPAALFEEWVYVAEADEFLHVETRTLVGPPQLNQIFKAFYPGGKKPTAANAFFRAHRRGRRVQGIDYLPGKPLEVAADGEHAGVRINFWRRPTPAPGAPVIADEADVQPWLDVLARVTPDAETALVLLDYLSLLVQRPEIRPNWSVVMLGPQGAGKDTLWLPVCEALGRRNVAVVSGAILELPWSDYLLNAHVLLVQEVEGLTAKTVGKMKEIITTPPDRISVNRKGGRLLWITKTAIPVLFTNDPEALELSADDRRFFVVEAQPLPAIGTPEREALAAFWSATHAWLRDGGAAKVAAFLATRQIGTRLDVFLGRAPETAAKVAMVKATRRPDVAFLEDWIAEGEAPDLVTANDVAAAMKASATVGRVPSLDSIGKHLLRLGAQRLNGGGQIRLPASAGGGKVRLWSLRRHALYAQLPPDAIAEKYAAQVLQRAMTGVGETE